MLGDTRKYMDADEGMLVNGEKIVGDCESVDEDGGMDEDGGVDAHEDEDTFLHISLYSNI